MLKDIPEGTGHQSITGHAHQLLPYSHLQSISPVCLVIESNFVTSSEQHN